MRRTEIEQIIDEYVLNERDRKLLKRRLIDGIKFEPLAEEFELSTVRAKEIVRKWMCLFRDIRKTSEK